MFRSLRRRLLLGGSAAILAALVVAWVFMTFLFERHLDRRLTAEMTRDAVRLVAALSIDPAGRPVVGETALSDPRLEIPAGGLYWQVRKDAAVVASRSLWDQTLSPAQGAPGDDWRLRRAPGPFDAPVLILERVVRPDAAGPGVLVQLAQDASVVTGAQAEFGRELAAFLVLLWLFLSAAAWLQVELGLRPLAGVRRGLGALRDSPSARLPEPLLDDVRPLTEAVNDLAAAREAELERARARAADLAHGLKTPLAALMAQSRRLRDQGGTEIADGLDRSLETMRAVVEAQLARSRLAAAHGSGAADARALVEHLLSVIEQTDRGEVIAFTNAVPDDLSLPLAEDSGMEMLGPLIENAARFARRQVVVSARDDGGGVLLAVDDDGPGVPAELAEGALDRGARLDQTGAGGQGLGLAIARDLVEASGGSLSLTRSALGGLRAELRWAATA